MGTDMGLSGMTQYNSVFFSNPIKLSNCQSLYVGRGNFGERKIVTDQVGGPPVGLAIGVQGGARLLGRLGQASRAIFTSQLGNIGLL